MTAENNTPDPGAPDTIVLIHGLWVTPRSWEHWIERYEGRGYRVLAPAYPGLEVEVEALNEDPSPIEALTVPAVVEHYEGIVGELERPPIIIASGPKGMEVVRKDCSEEEIISRDKGRTLVLAIDILTRTPSPRK